MKTKVTIDENGVYLVLTPSGDFDNAVLRMLDHPWDVQYEVSKEYSQFLDGNRKVLSVEFRITAPGVTK